MAARRVQELYVESTVILQPGPARRLDVNEPEAPELALESAGSVAGGWYLSEDAAQGLLWSVDAQVWLTTHTAIVLHVHAWSALAARMHCALCGASKHLTTSD